MNFRWVPCQQKVGIVCERTRRFHFTSFKFPKTFQNNPFLKTTFPTKTFSKDPFSESTIVFNHNNVHQETIFINETAPALIPVLTEQDSPKIDQFQPTVDQFQPTVDQFQPKVDQFQPRVVVIEKKPVFNYLPKSRVLYRKSLFRINGLQNPYLNHHFRTNYWHSRVKK